jgi:hypothetical protein
MHPQWHYITVQDVSTLADVQEGTDPVLLPAMCCCLQMRKQDGTEYKPDALMGMTTSALRAYSSYAADKALSNNQAPPAKLQLKDCALLQNNLTAVMKQLHHQGLKSEHFCSSCYGCCDTPLPCAWCGLTVTGLLFFMASSFACEGSCSCSVNFAWLVSAVSCTFGGRVTCSV